MLLNEDREEIKAIVADVINEALGGDGIRETIKSAITAAKEEKKLTKDEILAVKNRAERQRLIKENMDLF